MRIIAGTARSLPLKTIEGLETRPTTDKIKETLFNMLQNDIRFRFIIRQFNSMTGKHTDHVLGIYQIFVTSE